MPNDVGCYDGSKFLSHFTQLAHKREHRAPLLLYHLLGVFPLLSVIIACISICLLLPQDLACRLCGAGGERVGGGGAGDERGGQRSSARRQALFPPGHSSNRPGDYASLNILLAFKAPFMRLRSEALVALV